MSPLRRFGPTDIGAELFHSLTSGLYRDPMDALREYVQNSIDAKASKIEIALTKDVISIRDDGTGMTHNEAVGAIRLGMSDKNPTDNVGFRGIGLYSGYNICDDLTIHTRHVGGSASTVRISFGDIRDMLADESKSRRTGAPATLHLERMLSQAVVVDDDPKTPLDSQGTLVQMVGIRPSVSRSLSDAQAVSDYLQNTVPLPFRPDFKYADQISNRLAKEDYRIVGLSLRIASTCTELYRPYYDEMFVHSGQFEPKIINLIDSDTKEKYGFVWVCINDARTVLENRDLRGLLIKKQGFSIANREYLEPYFTKTVLYRRMTGEVIAQHPELVPNAARSDFENNEARSRFRVALSEAISKLQTWGGVIQDQLKAYEVVDEAAPRVFAITQSLPDVRSDVNELTKLIVELAAIKKSLEAYKRILQKDKKDLFTQVWEVLEEAEAGIQGILSRKRKIRPRTLVRRAVERKEEEPTEEETVHKKDRPLTLAETLESLDIVVTEPMRIAVAYIDDHLVRPRLSPDDYAAELLALREFLEERV